MTSFTTPVIFKPLDTSYTIQSETTVGTAFRAGAIGVVSANGAGTAIITSAGNPVIIGAISSAGGPVFCRGFIRFVVDGTTAVVPFFFTNA